MIGIGANEKVYLEKAELDTKKNLILQFAEVDKAELAKMSGFDILSSAEVIDTAGGLAIRLFPPLPPKEGNDRTEEKNVDLLINDLNKTKAILFHIAGGYFTKDRLVMTVDGKVTAAIDMFRGMAQINKDNFSLMIQKKEVLEQLHLNMCTDFINLMKPELGNPEKAFRLFLVRQSKEKNFATFRAKYLDENPFWESMQIPQDASKLYTKDATGKLTARFTKYELEQGLDSAAPVDKKEAGDKITGDKGAASGSAPTTASNIFGNR